jgi:hypothetical protein
MSLNGWSSVYGRRLDFLFGPHIQKEILMQRRTFIRQIAGGTVALGVMPSMKNDGMVHGQEIDPIGMAGRARVFVLEHGAFWDIPKVVEILVRSNATAIRCDVGIYRGLVTMYPSRHLPPHPELGDRDVLRELLKACAKYGLQVFPYNAFYHYMLPETRERYPGWRMVNSDGSFREQACQNNPHFVQTFCEACQEIVQNYTVAGMYFDGPGELQNHQTERGLVRHPYCYCAFCREIYRSRYDGEMPLDANADHDPDLRNRMLEVHMQGMENLTRAVYKTIKAVRNVPVLVNACDPVERFIRHGSILQSDGALMAEIHRTTTFMEGLRRTKVGAAFGKAAWCYCPIGPHEQLVTYDDLETKLFGLTQLAHGGTPIIETLQSYLYDDTGLDAVRQLFAHMQQHELIYTSYAPVPFLGVLSSRQTAQKFSALETRNRSGHWGNEYFSGIFASLTHAHQHFSVLLDHHLQPEQLQPFKAIVLPNITCLSDRQVETIEQFVRNGGGLIATHHTSLYDEKGRGRGDFAFKDLFKAHYIRDQELTFGKLGDGDPYLLIGETHPIATGMKSNQLLFCERQNYPVVEVQAEGKVIAKMYLQNVGERMHPIDYAEARHAGIIISQYGKGRVVYCIPPIDMVYFRREFHLVRRLLSQAVDWVTCNQAPFTIEAPLSVVANLTENKTRRLLHLINYAGNRQEHLKAKVEWVAPLHGIRIPCRQREGMRLTDVATLMTKKALPFVSRDGFDVIELPELNEYEALLLNYA